MFLLLACASSSDSAPKPDSTPLDSGPTADAPLEQAFRLVVMADPHVYDSSADHQERLGKAVDWINSHAEEQQIELVLIVGDIAWGEGLTVVRPSLDALTVPWVPINGDNEIQVGSESSYHQTFLSQYEVLAGQLESFEMAPMPVVNLEEGGESWFHNIAFTYKGARFLGLDWCARIIDALYGEMGDLHDFEGGTWPWFTAQVETWEGADESVVMFSHIPMHLSPGGFDIAEMEALTEFLGPYANKVAANFAGHYHVNGENTEAAGYDVAITDAVWDDDINLRVVTAWSNGARFEWDWEIVVVE